MNAISGVQQMPLTQSLEQLTNELQPSFKPAVLQRDRTCFQFEFDEGDPFYLDVSDNTFRFESGTHDVPTITLFIDSFDTCRQLLAGTIDGMQMFCEGKYRADGNIVLSQLLLYLFKTDDLSVQYQVKD